MCEIEIQGTIVGVPKIPKSPPPKVFVAIGDCLAPTATMIGAGASTDGRFFIEVFAPWGSDLSVCAASESSPGAPTRIYGKAARAIRAEHGGEIEIKDVTVDLAPGPPHVFPRPDGSSRAD